MLSVFAHVQPLNFLSASRLSASVRTSASTSSMSSSVVRIAVVGDVHDFWDLEEDAKALRFLKPDLVLFTGDFGNENVEGVKSVGDLEFPKAVILGNHDAWRTQEFSGGNKNRVLLQLECLGQEHVAYRRLDFPILKLSVVGGRPFSHGGKRIFRKGLLSERYGVKDMDGSANKIYKAASGVPGDHLVIILAHNGPTGLGSEPNDICGNDFEAESGDHGDLDLAQAIALLKETTKICIPLVVFGHMHKQLHGGKGLRKMIAFGADNTIYLNGAIVPRVKILTDDQGTVNRSFMNNETSVATSDSSGTMRAFTLVEIRDGVVHKITETWVAVVGDMATLQEENILFKHGNQVLP
ncbi:uncharacterized protein LOC123200920 [Mangifera indica]|uniref:uncharacterized protein LOC123200920 n=1 Tax=Mangifera indica TaxID=29780 RepID=UPI001CFB13B0|nr:uncharacterized protein LOC123200920 [Mangifera indica]